MLTNLTPFVFVTLMPAIISAVSFTKIVYHPGRPFHHNYSVYMYKYLQNAAVCAKTHKDAMLFTHTSTTGLFSIILTA